MNDPSRAFFGMRKLPARYGGVVTPLVLTMLMTFIVSLISTLRVVGLAPGFARLWLGSWLMSWAAAFPTLLVVQPLVRRINAAIVDRPVALHASLLPSSEDEEETMPMDWTGQAFETIELADDERLDHRTALLAERLGQEPAACRSWAETAAVYRFLRNEPTSRDALMAAHALAGRERMREHAVVLCPLGTTELDYDGQPGEGLAPPAHGKQRGLYAQAIYAVTPEREPLGLIDVWTWPREPRNAEGMRPGGTESVRWIEAYERIAGQARELPATRLVAIGDCESDLLGLLHKVRELDHAADVLVRCKHSRVLPEGGKLWEAVMREAPLGRVRFTLPAGHGRAQRFVEQELRARRVALPHAQGAAIEVTCLIASEVDAPPGVKPVVWRLLSNRQTPTLQAACELVDYYRARREIELLFLVLKEGCRVERLQPAATERQQTALAFYMVMAWRIHRLVRLVRTLPDLPADLLFEPEEWQAAFVLNEQPLLRKHAPALDIVVRLIARRGGFSASKGDGEPGAKAIWRGLHDIAVLVEARVMRDSSGRRDVLRE